jgi:mannitol/fructose-specific phosphotransferase system IIA component (Ntr-type)
VWSKDSEKNKKKADKMEVNELIKYFSSELFIPNLRAKTKDGAMLEFANLFVESKVVRKHDLVLELLQKRETLGSTGIGGGVAIPHGRTTAALEVKIAFGKSAAGIDFEAIDKKPVFLFFVVLSPPHDENNRYLPILGKLVEVLNESKNRKKLMNITSFEEFIQVFEGVE